VPDPALVYTAGPRRSQAVVAMARIASPTSIGALADVRSPAEQAQSRRDATRQSRDDAACDVCPHGVSGHDAIGLRFCRATLKGAITRGCICRSS
jgi:hypothetical protein